MGKLLKFLLIIAIAGVILLGGIWDLSVMASEGTGSENSETATGTDSRGNGSVAEDAPASADELGEPSESAEEPAESTAESTAEESEPVDEASQEPEVEEPLFTADEIFENNLTLLAEEEFRRYHGEVGLGYALQENSGLSDFRYRYDYPNKALYLSRFGIRSLHPSHEFFDFVLASPREKSFYLSLSMLKDGGRIDIEAFKERFKTFGIYRDGTLFSNPTRFTGQRFKLHNPSYQDWWFAIDMGVSEFGRRNKRVNTQADTRQEWLNMDVTFAPYADASLNLAFKGERVYRDIGGERARDAYTYSADLTDPLSDDTTLQAGFSYTFAETYSLGGDLDRYRAYASLLGDRAFGHDCLDWKLHFKYLNNAGFAYIGAIVDDALSFGGSLSYDSGSLGTYRASYEYSNMDLDLLSFSLLPYDLKIAPFALESDYAPYRVTRTPKTHNFTFSNRVQFGLGFNLRQELTYERIQSIADTSILDFRYRNLFPTRRVRYRGDLTYVPCENWRWALSDRYERRQNSVRGVSFASNYLSLSGTYSPEADSSYTALLGRGDYNASDPTVSLYETDLVNLGFVVFKRFNDRLALASSYNFSYSTGRDKFESDEFDLYLTFSGKYPLKLGYEYFKLSEKFYPQATNRVHNFFLEYDYAF